MKKLLSSLLVLSLALGCCAPCFASETETDPTKNKTFVKKNTNANAKSVQSYGVEFKEIFKKCKDKTIDIAKNIANYKYINEVLVGIVMFFLGYKAYLLNLRWNSVWPFLLKPHLKKIIKDDDDYTYDFKENIKDIIDDIKIILFGFSPEDSSGFSF